MGHRDRLQSRRECKGKDIQQWQTCQAFLLSVLAGAVQRMGAGKRAAGLLSAAARHGSSDNAAVPENRRTNYNLPEEQDSSRTSAKSGGKMSTSGFYCARASPAPSCNRAKDSLRFFLHGTFSQMVKTLDSNFVLTASVLYQIRLFIHGFIFGGIHGRNHPSDRGDYWEEIS